MLTNTQGGSKTIPAIALGSIALEILEKPSVSFASGRSALSALANDGAIGIAKSSRPGGHSQSVPNHGVILRRRWKEKPTGTIAEGRGWSKSPTSTPLGCSDHADVLPKLSAEQRNARIEMVDRMTAGNALPINGEAQQLQPAGLLDSTSDLSKLSEEGDFVQGRPRPGLNSGKATVGALEDRIGGKLAV